MQQEKTGNGYHANVERVLEDLKMVVRDGQELLKARMGQLKEHARHGMETTDRFVHDKPLQSMGIAFGAGLLAGLLVSGLVSGKGEEQEEED